MSLVVTRIVVVPTRQHCQLSAVVVGAVLVDSVYTFAVAWTVHKIVLPDDLLKTHANSDAFRGFCVLNVECDAAVDRGERGSSETDGEIAYSVFSADRVSAIRYFEVSFLHFLPTEKVLEVSRFR